MRRSKHTKARHLKRFRLICEHGCVACKKRGIRSWAEIHHLTAGGRRLGHDDTIPLCPWHHRAVLPAGILDTKLATEIYGASLARGKKSFNADFGSEYKLLEEVDLWLSQVRESEIKAQGGRENSLTF